MKVRTRDFIYTSDDLFFASTNYIHPENRFISFLRYIPDENGDRELNGQKYSKVTSEEAYSFLRKNYPEYLYFCDVSQVEMMGVPTEKVKRIIKPEKRLDEIRKEKISRKEIRRDELENEEEKNETPSNNIIMEKLIKVAEFFHYKAEISWQNLGISGSILPNLQKATISDIDFVVYGLENHRKAMKTFEEYKDKEIEIELDDIETELNDNKIELNKNKTTDNSSKVKKIRLNSIQDSYWERIYNKRMKDSSLTKKEFCWYENRKNNRGIVDGTLFDILATRNWNEIQGKWGDTQYEPVGIAKIEGIIENAIASFDNPATYKIKNVNILEVVEGKSEYIEKINEIASFTHTYAGQAIENEEIIAKGKVERVLKEINTESKDNKDGNNENIEESYRLVVGTTRESIDEFIKLKNIPLKN